MATYSETSSGKKTKFAPVLAFIHEKAKKDQELKERELEVLEKKGNSCPDNVADLLLKQQQQYLEVMSEQHRTMHTMMATQHEQLTTALAHSQQQVTALVESQKQLVELVMVALGMQQRP